MRYFFTASEHGAQPQEITRDEAQELIRNTYGSTSAMLEKLERGEGTNASIIAPVLGCLHLRFDDPLDDPLHGAE